MHANTFSRNQVGEYYVNHNLWQTFLPEELEDALEAAESAIPAGDAYDTETALRLLNADGLVDDVAAKRERVKRLQAELEEWEASGGAVPTEYGGVRHESFEEPQASMDEQRLRTEVLEMQVQQLRTSMRQARAQEQQRNVSLRQQLRKEREHVEKLSTSSLGGSLKGMMDTIDDLLTVGGSTPGNDRPTPAPRTATAVAADADTEGMTPDQLRHSLSQSSSDRATLRVSLSQMEEEVRSGQPVAVACGAG